MTVRGRRLGSKGWGVAASAVFHVVLFALLVFTMKTRFPAPRSEPIDVEIVRIPTVERTTARPPQGVRPRPALTRPKDERVVTPLPIPPAPPATEAEPGPAAPPAAAPREVQFAPPPPVLRGLPGCTDDPVRNPDLKPCFDGTVRAQADTPAYRMTGAKVRAWDAAMAKQKRPAQAPFDECPLDSQASRLGFGCLPH